MTKSIEKDRKRSNNRDLTQGSIWKTIVRFSLPILLSYLLQNFYSVADAAICGYTLSASEVAGVNDTNSISFIFLQFAFGCTAGMSVILSTRIGRNDSDGVRKALATQIVLSFFIVVAVTVISLFTINPLLALLGVTPSDTSEVNNAVYNAAFTYISIICGGMIGQFAYNLICCVLRSLGNSLTPLIFLVISTALNIALDLVFIMACGWGVAGAAAATVISQLLSAIACFIFTFVRYKELRLKLADFKAMDMRTSLRTLWQGIPLGLQFSVLSFGILTMSNGVISFDKTANGAMVAGTPAQIGYSAACKLDNIFFTPFNALGTAMISFTGQNNGAGKHDRIRRGIMQTMLIMLVISAIEITAGLLLSVNGMYQHFFLASDKINSETIRFGNTYLYSALPFAFVLGVLLVLRNVIQGLGKPLFPFLAGIAELIARIVICIFLPLLANGGPINSSASSLSFFCLGLGDAVAWFAAAILLAIATVYYMRKLSNQTPQSIT
ncbi:MATE family efflux transporter [Pumilibacter intestinalis]|uniref:MATE family efflux transporter n=1 Tax=Pumilibacter intestinalis TaxID=2941511 RepID=UPI00203B8758|nr:MATE family efflux transporter [Pumilibacter intestinalis]